MRNVIIVVVMGLVLGGCATDGDYSARQKEDLSRIEAMTDACTATGHNKNLTVVTVQRGRVNRYRNAEVSCVRR